ncbi:MAG: hypothetical protein E3J42_02360 [Dehalococcoidia bacterium]|nr:MAG: hypothetical protein E3J42_02360 [Dehalococcoidia bacterium]
MIWFRRILTIPVIISFSLLLIFVLLITQVNDTLLNPGFYNDQMRQADMYNFVYDELLPVALDEVEEEMEKDDSTDFAIDISAIEDELVSAARKILPPEWLQDQVESATNSVIPYFLGDTDEFTYTIALRDRIDTAVEVINEDILQGDAFTSIYDDGMSYLADELFDNLDELPYTLDLNKEDIESSLRTVVAEDWIASQVEAAIDSVKPYMTGDSDEFTITVHLKDRVDAAADAVLDLFSREETYNYLLDEMITPTIKAHLGSIVNLPFGVSLSREEIDSTIREVLPENWVRARLSELVNGFAAYAKGEAESIEVTVDLADRKADALDALTKLADEKLQAQFASWEEYQEFKEAHNIDFADLINREILGKIPDQWVYTDADLRQSIGEDNEDFLDEARDWVSEGWTFTEVDLLDELDNDEEETLEDVRGWIESGYTLTETDLRERISDREKDLDYFDTARHWVGIGRTWLWTLWLIPFISLLFIGFSGGRNWRSRLAWVVVVLLLTSLAIYIATGQAYSNVGEPQLEEVMPDPSEYEGVEALMVEKGNEMIKNASSGFVSGIRSKTLYMMIASGVILLGVIGWSVASRRRETEESIENTT